MSRWQQQYCSTITNTIIYTISSIIITAHPYLHTIIDPTCSAKLTRRIKKGPLTNCLPDTLQQAIVNPPATSGPHLRFLPSDATPNQTFYQCFSPKYKHHTTPRHCSASPRYPHSTPPKHHQHHQNVFRACVSTSLCPSDPSITARLPPPL